MSNMSYCRFQNTLFDLKDCVNAINDASNGSEEDKLSRQELDAFKEMVLVMQDFICELESDAGLNDMAELSNEFIERIKY